MNKEQLLAELDSLGYSDRMKRMALLGRRHTGDADYSALACLKRKTELGRDS
ncbi:hypothetical protein [Paenibacillus campinasensis]|uniref:hypothetical protein n=1 Tax=Paenibacillus campinasensis TaxID=66347 RepID=UPI001C52EF03|nr:hypothetical protein [Paenibacillus campinasensis]